MAKIKGDKLLFSVSEEIEKTTTYPLNHYCTHYTIQITPTGGAAKVQTSNDGINFLDWDDGDVTGTTVATCFPVAFIKVVLSSATKVLVAIRGA